MISIVFGISVFALFFAAYLARYVLKQDTGTDKMREISDAIKEGANAFMHRQYGTIGVLSLVVAALIFGLYTIFPNPTHANYAWKTALSFLIGATCSGIAGFVGMHMAVRANIRVANAAISSLDKALRIALRAGAVSGLLVVAMSLLGVAGLFTAFGGDSEAPLLIVGFAFGASFVALFAQLGGGIYTKAADVGADLVGKVEKGIPEDDPRNPAVIADLVGDNVGDCAGRGADLFESTAAENIGAMILGIALYPVFGLNGILFPLVARAFGIIASIVGVMVVKSKEDGDPMAALNKGYYVTAILSAIGFGVATYLLLNEFWIAYLAAGIVGIVTAVLFALITQYYTEHKYRPVKEIAESSQTGAATNIISGFAVGLESTGLPVLVISAALIGSYWIGSTTGVPHGGIYGTAIATMGMLATAAYVLAMDNFGPITDNAGGIIEMSGQPAAVRKKTDRLDAVGNTTKALTKGYAIGSAALAAFLLFSAYLDEIRPHGIEGIDMAKPAVFVGGLIGAALIFMFSSLAIRAVGKAAYCIINEVRRQFKANDDIMTGKAKPDYATCVDIATVGALKEMVLPGILAIAVPIFVGIALGPEAAGALLMVGTIAGILMALVLNTGGGAWDNAKKFIESGVYGGKGSDAHKAAVVGDTVGDPFKDTAGPSLHVLIKLLSTLTLVLVSLFLMFKPPF